MRFDVLVLLNKLQWTSQNLSKSLRGFKAALQAMKIPTE
jgi:hypothetical protein